MNKREKLRYQARLRPSIKVYFIIRTRQLSVNGNSNKLGAGGGEWFC